MMLLLLLLLPLLRRVVLHRLLLPMRRLHVVAGRVVGLLLGRRLRRGRLLLDRLGLDGAVEEVIVV